MINNMHRHKTKKVLGITAVLVSVMLLFGCNAGDGGSKAEESYAEIAVKTAEYIDSNLEQISPGAIGGEWVLVGKAKSGAGIDASEKDAYMNLLKTQLEEKDGVLDERKYSEYSRSIIGLSAIGESADNIAGYNLFEPLEDFDKVIFQGINGPIWAIIAADSQQYDLKAKQQYIDYLIENQLSDGGFALMGEQPDADITAMAIMSLSPYYSEYKEVIDKAVSALADMQAESGEYASFDTETSESCSQVIMALCSLGTDPTKDERFIKDGKSLVDILMGYRNDDGGFSHVKGEESNQMASEQALLAFAALKCMESGETLYR